MRELIAQAEAPDWLHLKPFGYAPGNYMGGCQACKTMMYNVDKRAITCRPCAEKAFAAAMQPAEAVAHIVSSGRAGMPLLQWMSADHSFRAPIGTKLYAHPDPRITEPEQPRMPVQAYAQGAAAMAYLERIAALETLLRDILLEAQFPGSLVSMPNVMKERVEAALGKEG